MSDALTEDEILDAVESGLRAQGPDLDQRKETMADVIYAIRNGGYSGAIMPENIVVGKDADDVAQFLAKYSGLLRKTSPQPDPPCPLRFEPSRAGRSAWSA